MNLLTKTRPWMIASLLAATSVFGQNQSQNQNQNQGSCQTTCKPQICRRPPKCGPLQEPRPPTVCAYNAPAEINIGIECDWDVFVSGSFVYWQPLQDNMSVAFVDSVAPSQAFVLPGAGIKGSFVDMDFEYKPGFKVGLGMNFQNDDWYGYSEYTRVHGDHSVSSNGAAASDGNGTIFPTWGHPLLTGVLTGTSSLFNYVSSTFQNNLDFVDAELGRVYYVGKSLIFHSAWGARAAWILESMSVHYRNTASPTVAVTSPLTTATGALNVTARTHSWGIGPRVGLTMDWMLGCGIRFFGSSYGDILYTKYNLKHETVWTPYTGTTSGVPVTVSAKDEVGLLRTHLDLEMGFGWGTYLDNNNWHLDLSAAYGFQVFFDQNMFRNFENGTVVGTNFIPNGNLYVQGLTVTARVDF